MKNKRIFIAINLSKEIKRDLGNLIEEWKELPVRWIDPKNFYLTLEFIGIIKEERLEDVLFVTKKATEFYPPFYIKFNQISYSPREKTRAQMIWARVEKTREIMDLKKRLRDLLIKNGFLLDSEKIFSPHIALGRIKNWQWRRIDLEELPEIYESFIFEEKIFSISVIESILKKSGPEHKIIRDFNFKDC